MDPILPFSDALEFSVVENSNFGAAWEEFRIFPVDLKGWE